MNKEILNTGIQDFINKNLNTDISSLLLKKSIFDGVSNKEIAEQIESKKKCQKKLPTWFHTKKIYYSNKLNIEQTSSEVTAQYKANLISGKKLIDLTGGFGVDSYFFSKKISEVTHCEMNENLSEIASYNFKILGAENVHFISEDGISFLKKSNQKFDWIYIDPSRRNDLKGKVFLLKDCFPEIPGNLEEIFKHSNNILIKTSPLLDISIGINELNHVKEIHVVAINNDVKELLWVLEKDFEKEITIKTINYSKEHIQYFNFILSDEKKHKAQLAEPEGFLYEPNSAILKAGAFNIISERLKVKKLHQHSHLYTSNDLIDFPGRSFKIQKVLPYNKKILLKELKITKTNITTRNFPETVKQIRQKLKIDEGGDTYLFFTINIENKKIVIICIKNSNKC